TRHAAFGPKGHCANSFPGVFCSPWGPGSNFGISNPLYRPWAILRILQREYPYCWVIAPKDKESVFCADLGPILWFVQPRYYPLRAFPPSVVNVTLMFIIPINISKLGGFKLFDDL